MAAGLADKCEIQVAYAIGVAKPMSINATTYGTGKVADEKIAELLLNGGIFDFRPGMLVKDLDLTHPTGYASAEGWTYRKSSNYGHFGREGFPWERLDKVEAIKAAL